MIYHDIYSFKIFVRSVYNTFLQKIVDKKIGTSIFISGNPGTGKTMFGLYLACRSVADGKNVLYERGDEKYKFYEGQPKDADIFIFDITDKTVFNESICSTQSTVNILDMEMRNSKQQLHSHCDCGGP